MLLDVTRDGRTIDAVAQATKSGHVFVFDRETGAPLFPIEERPRAGIGSRGRGRPGRRSRCRCGRPPSRARPSREADATDLTPGVARRRAGAAAPGAQRRPVRAAEPQGTVIFPGFDGGAEWGGSAFDPETRLLYVNANEMPWILEMRALPRPGGLTLGARVYAQHCAVCHGAERQGVPRRRSSRRSWASRRSRREPRRARSSRRQGRHAGASRSCRAPSGRRRSQSYARGEREPDDAEGEAARAGAPLRAPRLQPLPRPRGLPRRQAALGHAQRDRPRRGRDPLVGPARRAARADRGAGSRPRAPRTTAARS